MKIPLFQVDAFTDPPFAGNPAAVCLLPEAQDDKWMQAVAAEMNLSETAFLLDQDNGYPASIVIVLETERLLDSRERLIFLPSNIPAKSSARIHGRAAA